MGGKKGNVDGGDGQCLQGDPAGYEDPGQDLDTEKFHKDARVGGNESISEAGGHGPWKTGE